MSSLINIPTAFFSDHPNAKEERNQLIKNNVRVNEEAQGDLEEYFFSDDNINLINKQLILSIYKKTNNQIKIPPQSKQSLIIVMRYIYIEYAKHLPYNIAGQIRELNCRVVSEIIPKIITETTQRIDYLKHINNKRTLMPLPINVNKGHREIQSIESIF
jgi:hypothetical protein